MRILQIVYSPGVAGEDYSNVVMGLGDDNKIYTWGDGGWWFAGYFSEMQTDAFTPLDVAYSPKK